MSTATAGKVVQVIGPVLDVEFDADKLPELYNALEIKGRTDAGDDVHVVAEVQQHIGRNQVRAVAMSSSDGISRGMDAVDTGAAISVPVGAPALGRILNVLGEPVDNGEPIPASAHPGDPDALDLLHRVANPLDFSCLSNDPKRHSRAATRANALSR